MSEPNNPSNPGGENPSSMQRISHQPMSARVPEKVARGVVSTGVLVYYGQNEFVIDFLQFIARPAHLAARVVMAPAIAEQFLNVLRENLGRYTQTYGAPPPIAKNPQDKPRSAQEIYDDLKLSDDQLAGVYANAVLVGHTPAEFGLDFITSFLPNAVVSARVYMGAQRIPQLIETLSGLVTQYQKQRQQGAPQQPSPGQNPGYGNAPGIPGFPTPPDGN